jgi:hypothetical protein
VLSLDYRTDGKPIQLPIRLQTTRPHLGGVRWWFTCPLIIGSAACLQAPSSPAVLRVPALPQPHLSKLPSGPQAGAVRRLLGEAWRSVPGAHAAFGIRAGCLVAFPPVQCSGDPRRRQPQAARAMKPKAARARLVSHQYSREWTAPLENASWCEKQNAAGNARRRLTQFNQIAVAGLDVPLER